MPTPISPTTHSPPAASATDRLADRLTDFLARVSPEGTLRFVSPQGLAWLRQPADLIDKGHSLFDAIAPEDRPALREALAAAQDHEPRRLSLRMLRGGTGSVRVLARVLSLMHTGTHQELLFAAWDPRDCLSPPSSGETGPAQDGLTGLHNRDSLLRQLADLCAAPPAPGSGFTLLHLGLDGFQKVNDALGHAVGDRLLVEAGRRLVGTLRAADKVARTGGDEFAVILRDTFDRQAALNVARKLQSALQRPFQHGDTHLHVTASIGLAQFPEHATDGQQLFKCADMALTLAKESGPNRCLVYAPEGGTVLRQRVLLEERMYDAFQNGEFDLHYQPLFRAQDGGLVGFEALMRWTSPGQGNVSPAEFIPLAEKNGLIGLLGAWSLRASCHQMANWNKAWDTRLSISVNLSPHQFRHKDLAGLVRNALRESGLPADCLTLEITEGELMHDPAEAASVLDQLREQGVRISVDDFGTGYSSMAYLKRFPLSSLKIDRSFVRDLGHDGSDQAIVSAILSLAKALGLKVVAEGVETDGQLAILQARGCDLIQGFLLGRPAPAAAVESNVDTGKWIPRK
ncbi:MAG TPA: GGDEF domain-containing protein [Thiobacillaceae bacterium]|nr:GGDEF domain-containing protein [Thiobacillaceae bacterium]